LAGVGTRDQADTAKQDGAPSTLRVGCGSGTSLFYLFKRSSNAAFWAAVFSISVVEQLFGSVIVVNIEEATHNLSRKSE